MNEINSYICVIVKLSGGLLDSENSQSNKKAKFSLDVGSKKNWLLILQNMTTFSLYFKTFLKLIISNKITLCAL